MPWLSAILLCALAGYLCGSLPFGFLAGKLKGIDIRRHGSGNIGATNAIRVLGKGIGIPVFILDMLKGWLPVVLAQWWLARNPPEALSAGMVAAGFTSVLGHMFPFWLGFKGGKGVATMAGVLIGIEPLAMCGALLAWLIVLFITRYVSLASLASAVGVPASMAVLMFYRQQWDWILLGLGLVVMVLVFLRHRSNISRLLAGTEPRMGQKKTAAPAS